MLTFSRFQRITSNDQDLQKLLHSLRLRNPNSGVLCSVGTTPWGMGDLDIAGFRRGDPHVLFRQLCRQIAQSRFFHAHPAQLLDEHAVAAYYRISARTLEGYRLRGGGVPFFKLSATGGCLYLKHLVVCCKPPSIAETQLGYTGLRVPESALLVDSLLQGDESLARFQQRLFDMVRESMKAPGNALSDGILLADSSLHLPMGGGTNLLATTTAFTEFWLARDSDHVSQLQAASAIGVSIDAVRKWAEKGVVLYADRSAKMPLTKGEVVAFIDQSYRLKLITQKPTSVARISSYI